MKVEFTQPYKDNKQSHFWFGGVVAKMHHKGYDFYISAVGDVIGSLTDEKGEEIAYIKDTSNGGWFENEMSYYIKNDTELYDLEEQGRLVFTNNNWWEVYIEKDQIEMYYDVLDSYLLLDSVDEVVANADLLIDYIENKGE